MVKEDHIKIIEGKLKTYMIKQALMKGNDTSFVLNDKPFLLFWVEHPSVCVSLREKSQSLHHILFIPKE